MNKNLGQRGYIIQMVLVIFAIIIGMFIFPFKPPKPVPIEGCIVGEAADPGDEFYELKQLPAVSGIDIDPVLAEGGGPDPGLKADYVMIRKNVPVDSYAMLHIRGVSNPLFTSLEPRPGYTMAYPSGDGGKRIDGPMSALDLRLRHEGLIFFINKDPSTVKKVKLPNRRTDGVNGVKGTLIEDIVYEVDVYQDKRKLEESDKGYKTEGLFTCGSEAAITSVNVVVPPQEVSPNKEQLQLEWFLFENQGVWGVHCKPAVYLYPQRRQLVNVKVFPKGELSYTDPPYDPAYGWTVWAGPDGKLMPNAKFQMPNAQYDYLYYESKILDQYIKKPSKGWVVRFDEMEGFYNEALPKLGLNEKEKADFIGYWSGKLPESAYYFVGLVDKNQRDFLEPLFVTPVPDTSIRFSLYFEPLDQPINVTEPEIVTQFRNGFTLVDWGGMVKLHPGTPFTCSQ